MKQFTTQKCLTLILAFFAISTLSFGQKYTGLIGIPSDGATSTVAMFDGATTGAFWQTSDNSDGASVIVDLGSIKEVSTIKIYWEGANSKDFNLSFSNDNSTYTGAIEYTNMAAGARIDNITGLTQNCRYIKMQGVTRQLPYGYAMYEFEVYPAVVPQLTSLVITPSTSSINIGSTQQFTVSGLDQIGQPIALIGTTTWGATGSGSAISSTGLFSSTSKGLFTVTATNSTISANTTIEVLPINANLSIGATATASSGDASLAINNDLGNRWESAQSDPQWIMVDLGSKKNISDIIIYWEGANAKDYIIEGSLDGTNWTKHIDNTNMDGGARVDRIYNQNFDAQYVRLTGTARNLTYGYSIFELQIFGSVSTSLKSNKANDEVTIYPNPASTTVSIQGIDSDAITTIYNIVGQVVLNSNNINNIDVSNLPAGSYIVQIMSSNGNATTKKLTIK